MEGSLVLHIPPPGTSLSNTFAPRQIWEGPFIVPGLGNAVTVTIVVVKHPAGNVYVITEVPTDTAVITPDSRPIGATAGVPEIQVPSLTASVNVSDVSKQK